MQSKIEILNARGGVRELSLGDGVQILGSSRDADLVVAEGALEGRHLRFVPTSFGWRVEPVRPGTTVEVGGEALFCKDLEPGDEIAVGGVRLRWVAAPAARIVSPPSRRPRDADPRPSRRRLRPPRRAGVGILPLGAMLLAVVGGAFVALRSFAGSTWPYSPQHYVDLARAQLGNGQPDRALDTLEFALRDATGRAREEALQLQAEIRRAQQERIDRPRLEAAGRERDLLQAFERRYLAGVVERPAARELVRQCDTWFAAYGALCREHLAGADHLAAVKQLRDRHLAAAALDEPDTAEDVIFAARARLRFQWRDYRGAIAALDEFLRRGPSPQVEQEREAMLADGEAWLQQKLRGVDVLLDRGDTRNAGIDLDQLERWATLPQWQPLVAARRARLAGR